ncbi:hypothetical protein BOX15_Mlig015843g3, partial [Macrostomum lignano]
HTPGCTQEKSHLSAKCAARDSVSAAALLHTPGCTQEKSHLSAKCAARDSVTAAALLHTPGCTQEKSHLSAKCAARDSVTAAALLHTPGSTQEEKPFEGKVCGKRFNQVSNLKWHSDCTFCSEQSPLRRSVIADVHNRCWFLVCSQPFNSFFVVLFMIFGLC